MQRIFGIVMIMTAIAIALNFDVLVTSWLTNALPSGLSSALARFETSSAVNEQLDALTNSDSSGYL